MNAPGHGVMARMKLQTARASACQGTSPSFFSSLGAKSTAPSSILRAALSMVEWAAGSWDCSSTVPASTASREGTIISAASAERRAESSPAVSSSPMRQRAPGEDRPGVQSRAIIR